MRGKGVLLLWELVLTQLNLDMKEYEGQPDSVEIPPEKAKHEQEILRLDVLPQMLAKGEIKTVDLDTCLYTSGLWYTEKEKHQRKCNSIVPSVLNNNWIIGNQQKIDRAKFHKHWFLSVDSCFDWNATLQAAIETFRS